MKKTVFTVGARGSALSRAQTAGALDFLRARFPGTDYRVVTVETPGDRDLTTPIEKSAPDFFTRDLDDAVRAGAWISQSIPRRICRRVSPMTLIGSGCRRGPTRGIAGW